MAKFPRRGPTTIDALLDEEAVCIAEAMHRDQKHRMMIQEHLIDMARTAFQPPAIALLIGWTALWIGRGFRRA